MVSDNDVGEKKFFVCALFGDGDDVGIDADARPEDDAVSDAEERAVEDGDAAGPERSGADACAPKAEPEGVESGDEPDDLFQKGEAVEDHLELEGEPPGEEGCRADGGVVGPGAAGGQERAGEDWGEDVENG